MVVIFKPVLFNSPKGRQGPITTMYPCDHLTACHILHAVKVLGWKQDQAAFYFCVNSGTVSKIVRGLSHYGASPLSF